MKTMILASLLMLSAYANAETCTDLDLGAKAVARLVDILQEANHGGYSNTDQSLCERSAK